MATIKYNDACLPFAALQLLAPPVRLLSAAMWKVLKNKDVMQYGIVEEIITSACETVPGLLTLRHQSKLVLGLRARLILELCCTRPDAKVIAAHLERICVPTVPSSSSTSTVKKDVKIMRTVENFHSFINTILTNQEERERFFEFSVDYGPKFDQELENLLWEFLIRLDQLLPVPNLVQTVSWLTDAPAVLEECAQAATQPQLLKMILEHQACLGHLESAASLPPNMGDSILASLSLPPSGRVASNKPTGGSTPSAEQFNITQPRDTTPFITPVIGLISNEDVPIMISASKRTIQGDEASSTEDGMKEKLNPKESSKFTLIKNRQKPKHSGAKEGEEELKEKRNTLNRSGGIKRKQADAMESNSDDEDKVLAVTTSGGKRMRISKEDKKDQRGNEECRRQLLTHLEKLGFKTLHLPDDPHLCAIFASCLSSQPRVILKKLSVMSPKTHGRRGKSSVKEGEDQSKSLATRRTRSHWMPECLALDDKENHPVLSSSGSSQQRMNTETGALHGDGNDYVADSEDEATKNFKNRLFNKRYYRTKYGTYVPTLREFWKPGVTRRDLLSAGSKQRC
ncbi:TERF1-interacting nuclear factor 2 isoform X2 [Melanotaenia boesemani]|uniref:TERF1-interacting nuclear factor 2 isoform X2 n=1 Tax=Melanotaenia boesemani TaxID=1250792 RepID=UPI001C04B89C|nr:TERF1-interacting nuclear factor 2 isoform X2 [Melanotaenia boesemani]